MWDSRVDFKFIDCLNFISWVWNNRDFETKSEENCDVWHVGIVETYSFFKIHSFCVCANNYNVLRVERMRAEC